LETSTFFFRPKNRSGTVRDYTGFPGAETAARRREADELGNNWLRPLPAEEIAARRREADGLDNNWLRPLPGAETAARRRGEG
jgi:hypothetical protein